MDTETDPKLAAKLQTGEGIWLSRDWRSFFAAAFVGAGAFLFVCVAAMGGRPVPLVAIVLTGLYVLAAVWVWAAVLFSHLRFSGTFMEITRGLPRQLRLQDIVAARIVRDSRGYYYSVLVHQLTPKGRKASRWVGLWAAPSATKAETLLAELRRRCDLTEVSPLSSDYRTTVWQRPGLDPNLLALKWWQK